MPSKAMMLIKMKMMVITMMMVVVRINRQKSQMKIWYFVRVISIMMITVTFLIHADEGAR